MKYLLVLPLLFLNSCALLQGRVQPEDLAEPGSRLLNSWVTGNPAGAVGSVIDIAIILMLGKGAKKVAGPATRAVKQKVTNAIVGKKKDEESPAN